MAPDLEWDERKRLSNIAKHGFDFFDVDLLFGGPHIRSKAFLVNDEERFLATGYIGDLPATVIFTYRGNTVRVISLRRARNGERNHYEEVFGPRT